MVGSPPGAALPLPARSRIRDETSIRGICDCWDLDKWMNSALLEGLIIDCQVHYPVNREMRIAYAVYD